MSGLLVDLLLCKDGYTTLATREVPCATVNGQGQIEVRPAPASDEDGWGPWHTSAEGQMAFITVLSGCWAIEVDDETKRYEAGATVIIDDFDAIRGHRSRNDGSEPLILQKVIIEKADLCDLE